MRLDRPVRQRPCQHFSPSWWPRPRPRSGHRAWLSLGRDSPEVRRSVGASAGCCLGSNISSSGYFESGGSMPEMGYHTPLQVGGAMRSWTHGGKARDIN